MDREAGAGVGTGGCELEEAVPLDWEVGKVKVDAWGRTLCTTVSRISIDFRGQSQMGRTAQL